MKTLTIMRGLPGVGKSSALSSKIQAGHRPFIVSTDHYFLLDGFYHFDPTKLGQAHDRRRALDRRGQHQHQALGIRPVHHPRSGLRVHCRNGRPSSMEDVPTTNCQGVPLEKIVAMRASYER